jgi:hypothetical protein
LGQGQSKQKLPFEKGEAVNFNPYPPNEVVATTTIIVTTTTTSSSAPVSNAQADISPKVVAN